MAAKKFHEYADSEVHRVQADRPESFRAGLYLHARRKNLKAKAYIDWTTLPHPTVVFRLGEGPLPALPDAPKRGQRAQTERQRRDDAGF